jgi:hypothetical protein
MRNASCLIYFYRTKGNHECRDLKNAKTKLHLNQDTLKFRQKQELSNTIASTKPVPLNWKKSGLAEKKNKLRASLNLEMKSSDRRNAREKC